MDKLGQIASEVGVSPNTVLRVLRGQNKELWPSTVRRAEQIRRLAVTLGYLPNGSARAMRRGRYNCVSLLLSTDVNRSYTPADLLTQIHTSLDKDGIRLAVMRLPDEKLTSETFVPAMLRDWSSDGLLINYSDHVPHEMTGLLRRYHVPSIWINRKQVADCVYYDDFGGAMEGTRHLLRLGHRRIAYLDFAAEGPATTHYSRIDRYQGFDHAMRGAGLDPAMFPQERFAGLAPEVRLKATLALLTSPDRPTAIITYDAGDRLLYAAALAGLKVPEQLSLLTFVPRGPSAGFGEMFIGRSLTTMRVPTEKAGCDAVRMLLQKIENPDAELSPTLVPLELVLGDTAGPVSKGR